MNVEFVPADTTREAALVQLEIYRRMPPGKKLEQVFELSDGLHEIVAAGVRGRHPDYDEKQVKLAVIRLTVGPELFRKAYPGVEIKI